MRNTSSLLLLTIVLLFANAADSADTKSLGEKAMTILEQRCYRCHGGLATFAGVDVLDRASLFGTTDGSESDDALVIKNHASDSRLWQQIESNEMPKLGSEEADAMSDEERITIERWIDEGAELPFRKVEKPMRNEELFTLIDKFIQSRPIAERKFYRFFSLANLINDETVTVKDLRYTYAALIKVLNSLNHTNPRTIDVLPVADSRGALFAFDLRELGWEDTDNWDFLLKNYTYGVQFDFSETRSLKAACLNVCQITGTSQPMIRADWFVVYATQHPLYTKLLAIPETLTEMQQRLGVISPRISRPARSLVLVSLAVVSHNKTG